MELWGDPLCSNRSSNRISDNSVNKNPLRISTIKDKDSDNLSD